MAPLEREVEKISFLFLCAADGEPCRYYIPKERTLHPLFNYKRQAFMAAEAINYREGMVAPCGFNLHLMDIGC